MQQKANNNAKKAPAQKQLPKVNDFFTTFLDDQIANNKQKLKRIAELKSLPQADLTKPQIEKISRKAEVKSKIDELDNIRTLYLVAYQKSGQKNNTQASNNTSCPIPDLSEQKTLILGEASASVAQLLTLGKALHSKTARSAFAQSHQAALIQYGPDFLNGLDQLYSTVIKGDLVDATTELNNYLNESNLLNSAGNIPYSQLNEGVSSIVQSEAFKVFVPPTEQAHTAPAKQETAPAKQAKVEPTPAPQTTQEAPAQVETQQVVEQVDVVIQLVKQTPTETHRKQSHHKRSRLESEAQEAFEGVDSADEDEAKQKKEAKKVATEQKPVVENPWKTVKNTDKRFGGENPRARGRGGRGRGGEFRGRGGRGGRGGEYKPREGEFSKDDKTEGGRGRGRGGRPHRGSDNRKNGEKRTWIRKDQDDSTPNHAEPVEKTTAQNE